MRTMRDGSGGTPPVGGSGRRGGLPACLPICPICTPLVGMNFAPKEAREALETCEALDRTDPLVPGRGERRGERREEARRGDVRRGELRRGDTDRRSSVWAPSPPMPPTPPKPTPSSTRYGSCRPRGPGTAEEGWSTSLNFPWNSAWLIFPSWSVSYFWRSVLNSSSARKIP